MRSARGRFIVLEGTDGSGTTTQCRRLTESLRQRGIDCLETREPSTGPIGKLLRLALQRQIERDDGGPTFTASAMALLFAADRLDHVAVEIEPALARGQWVVSDRYTLSSLIYQSLTAASPRDALQWVKEINRDAVAPDLVLILDVTAEVSAGRRAVRGGIEELYDGQSLQQKLAEAYRDAEKYCSLPHLHVDGSASPEAVAAAVFREVERRLLATP